MHPIHTISPTDPTPDHLIPFDQVKEHLKIDFDYEDDLIKGIIGAAVEVAENYTGIILNKKSVVLKMKGFAPVVPVNYSPIIKDSVKVEYYNVLGNKKTYGDFVFTESFGDKPKFFHVGMDEFPMVQERYDAVQISYDAGFDPETLPKPIVQAILLIIADLYEFRTDRQELINTRAIALLRPYKIWI